MTTTQKPHTVIVTGNGTTKGGKPYLTAEPWFKSKFPLTVYCTEEQVEAYPRGKPVTVVRGNLGKDKDPKFESSYYYDITLDKPADPSVSPAQSNEASSTKSEPRQYDYAAERRSIERQTALKAAVEMSVDDSEAVLRIAEAFYQWLSDGRKPSETLAAGAGVSPPAQTPPASQPAAPAPVQKAPLSADGEGKAPAPSLTNPGTFWMAVHALGAKLGASTQIRNAAVEKILGGMLYEWTVSGKSYDEAFARVKDSIKP